jgi:hypothetical protein
MGANNPMYTGVVRDTVCAFCNKTYKTYARDSTCCSKECMDEYRKISSLGEKNAFFGKQHTQETKKILHDKHCKGYLQGINKALRSTTKCHDWRIQVFERDKYTCQICNKTGGILNAHHKTQLNTLIKNYCEVNKIDLNIITPDEIFKTIQDDYFFDVDNGITLCLDDHKMIHKREL